MQPMSIPGPQITSRPILKKSVILLMTLLIFAISGCALNPYVAPVHPVKSDGTVDTSLGAARKYASDLQGLYRREVGRQAILQSAMGGGLIAAGATVLGMAAYGAHTDAILGVGLGAGTTYTLGHWYINDPRQQTYLEGIKGIHCAKAAILPLDISGTDMTRFTKHLDALSKGIGQVSGDIGAVEAILPWVDPNASGTSALAAAARSNMTAAKTLLENAAGILTSGESLVRLANSAGARLMTSVEKISIEVDLAIQQGSPKLSAIPDIVRGLSDTATLFVPGMDLAGDLAAAFAPSQDASAAILKESTAGEPTGLLVNAMARLNTSARDLDTLTKQVSGFIQEIQDASPVETLRACGVELPASVLDISLTPAALTFTAKKASEKLILVEGGTKPYAAQLLDTTEKGITVHSPIPGDSTVRVTVTGETAPGGPYQLLIMDATMAHKKIIPITIQAASTETVSKGADNGTNKAITTAWTLTKPEDIKTVQRKLCTKDDGKNKDNTALAIRIFQQVIVAEKADGVLTEDQFKSLVKIKDCKDSCPYCLNYFEIDLSSDEILTLRANLGLGPGAEPTTIEEDMRTKIRELPGSKDPKASSRGQLTKVLQDQINKNQG